MTDRPIVLPAASMPDSDALPSLASREAEVLWEELVEAVRALAAALESAVLAERASHDAAAVSGCTRLLRETRALAHRMTGRPTD